jgi:hypothetical protein
VIQCAPLLQAIIVIKIRREKFYELMYNSLATHRELSLFWKLALTMAVNTGYQKRKRVKTTPFERKSRSRSSNRKYPSNLLSTLKIYLRVTDIPQSRENISELNYIILTTTILEKISRRPISKQIHNAYQATALTTYYLITTIALLVLMRLNFLSTLLL